MNKGNGSTLIRYIKRVIAWAMGLVFSLFPIHDDRVFFVLNKREEIGGNEAYVYEAMPEGMDVRFHFKKGQGDAMNFTRRCQMVYNLCTSKYVIMEDVFGPTQWVRIRKQQQLCQLWHGAGAFKKFAFGRVNGNETLHINRGYKKYAKAIVSSESIRQIYADSFRIDVEKVQATGIPRTDLFFNEEKMNEVREGIYKDYPELRNKKIVLFAPTYRGEHLYEAGYDYSKLDIDRIYQELGDDYAFIFKWHPAAYNMILKNKEKVFDIEKYPNFYYDFSATGDINDLLLITDVLITDYSSVIFDYYFMDKPVIYYAYDEKDYIEDGRGLYYSFDTYHYGLVAHELPELIDAIKKEDRCEEKREAFYQQFLSACDGHSTERTCNWIFKDVLPKA